MHIFHGEKFEIALFHVESRKYTRKCKLPQITIFSHFLPFQGGGGLETSLEIFMHIFYREKLEMVTFHLQSKKRKIENLNRKLKIFGPFQSMLGAFKLGNI